MRVIIKFLFGLIVIVAGAFSFLYYQGVVSLNSFERTSPTLELLNVPTGIGVKGATLKVLLRDNDAGLDEAVIRYQQGGKPIELLRKEFSPGTKEAELEVSLNGTELGLRPGEVKIEVHAFDQSFFSNSGEISINLATDFETPRVEIYSAQHNVNRGGIELAFYRVNDESAKHGVRVGDKEFLGFKATALDQAFETEAGLKFAFFAIPASYNEETDGPPVAFAEDAAGNRSEQTFYYRIIPRRFRTVNSPLTLSFLRSVLPNLLPKATKDPNATIGVSEEELVKQFRVVNEVYRAELLSEMQKILLNTSDKMLWTIPFIRPLQGSQRSDFSEKREYFLGEIPAGTSLHEGLDLAAVAHSPVFAVNSGKVLFAGDFGIYGDTVMVDHGLGLSSLYGHLSRITVSEGQDVVGGDQLGVSGSTGLAGGDHLHFEYRLQGLSVNPVEWWDESWIKEHIFRKVEAIKEQVAPMEESVEENF